MKRFLQFIVLLYQKILSPFLGGQCRFTPTCSCYMHEALEKHGAIKGLLLGIIRIIRCNPWIKASWIDPVPEQFIWSKHIIPRFAPMRFLRYKARKQ